MHFALIDEVDGMDGTTLMKDDIAGFKGSNPDRLGGEIMFQLCGFV